MPATSTDALVLVDKPAGVTSFDVVRQVGRGLGTRRVGHAGTLDPFATGLLVVLSGRATRCIRFVPTEPKVYLATIAFGTERDTDDLTGAITREGVPPREREVRAALPTFTGVLQQVPPAFSAKKVDGKRAYAMARVGTSVELAPAEVTVQGWDVVSWTPGHLVARVTCGTGTYIRALARDLGRACNSAAHLEALRRERCGPFGVAEATPWAAVKEGDLRARDPLEALPQLQHTILDAAGATRVRHGGAVDLGNTPDAEAVVMCGPGNEWLGIGRLQGGLLQPMVVHG
jgi:tRNA pseudouridine55 synthase